MTEALRPLLIRKKQRRSIPRQTQSPEVSLFSLETNLGANLKIGNIDPQTFSDKKINVIVKAINRIMQELVGKSVNPTQLAEILQELGIETELREIEKRPKIRPIIDKATFNITNFNFVDEASLNRPFARLKMVKQLVNGSSAVVHFEFLYTHCEIQPKVPITSIEEFIALQRNYKLQCRVTYDKGGSCAALE